MAIKTGITWTGEDGGTWNPWQGCHKVSQGCRFCYMFRDLKRYGKDPNTVIRSSPSTFNSPVTWYRRCSKRHGAFIFTCSWSDWFIDEADSWRDEAWNIVKNTPFVYLILTKRPENILRKLPVDWGDGYPNVWLGTTVESSEYIGRVDTLSYVPAILHFISAEPLLSNINFTHHLHQNHIQWMITGGESGANVRPMPKGAAESIIEDCIRYNVPVFHKQNGGSSKMNGVWGGDHIMGRVYHQFPDFHPRTTEFLQKF